MWSKKGIFEEISKTISCNLADLIEDVISISNEKKILYHGIKRNKSIEKIKKEGIKPLTPESGPCSFWSTGLALFYPSDDSPFFTYSGGHFPDPNTCESNLAITYYDLLLKKGLNLEKYKKDSQIKIKEVVPYEAITILNVKVRYPSSEEFSRKHRQTAEKILLKGISKQIHKGFPPGKVIELNA